MYLHKIESAKGLLFIYHTISLFVRRFIVAVADELFHHKIYCFHKEFPFIRCAGCKLVEKVPKLLFLFINVWIEQDVSRHCQSVDNGGQNLIGGVDKAIFYALKVPESSARLFRKFLLCQSAAIPLRFNLFS